MISKERVLWEALLQAEARMASLERMKGGHNAYGEFKVLHDVIGELRCQLRDDYDIDLYLLARESEEYLDKKIEIHQKKFYDNQKIVEEARELVARAEKLLDNGLKSH